MNSSNGDSARGVNLPLPRRLLPPTGVSRPYLLRGPGGPAAAVMLAHNATDCSLASPPARRTLQRPARPKRRHCFKLNLMSGSY